MLTGVNGVGKTTTIGKLAHLSKQSGYSCIIAAADTFRAAAVEQVKVWGERSQVEVIANPGKNTDPAAVVYDGIEAAKSREVELLLVDTAGRLQNKKNLMAELSKIRRIIDKKAESAVVESLLVLDATLGQNGLRQAEVFSEAAQLSGVILTKIDGTAKGGVALAVARQLNLPIRFVGAGEGIEDLRLGEGLLQAPGDQRLLELAAEGGVIGEEDILGHLLGDGRSALQAPSLDEAGHRPPQRPGDARRIHPLVAEKGAVLRSQEGQGQLWRNAVVGNKYPSLTAEFTDQGAIPGVGAGRGRGAIVGKVARIGQIVEEPGRVDGDGKSPDRHQAEQGHPSNGQPSSRGLHD